MHIHRSGHNCKFRLFVKKLSSGKFQVKFKVAEGEKKGVYGYVLVHSETTLKEVTKIIESRILWYRHSDNYYHQHLYSLGKLKQISKPLLVCRA